MPITNYAAEKHLNHDFNGAEYAGPTDWYVGFRKNGTELSGGNYSRIQTTADTTDWPTTATNVMENGTDITTPQATADWNEADEVALYDAASGGNLWYWDQLDFPFTMLTGQSRKFGPGALRIKLI